MLLLLLGITQVVVKKPRYPICPTPNRQQPWWANSRTHESFAGLLIDDYKAKSAPCHAKAGVRIYYHLASRVSAKAKFERGQVREELLEESVMCDIATVQSWLVPEKPRLDVLAAALLMSGWSAARPNPSLGKSWRLTSTPRIT